MDLSGNKENTQNRAKKRRLDTEPPLGAQLLQVAQNEPTEEVEDDVIHLVRPGSQPQAIDNDLFATNEEMLSKMPTLKNTPSFLRTKLKKYQKQGLILK